MGYPSYPEHPTRTVQRIYVASSWRNTHQPEVVEALRSVGFEVYDFRNPPGRAGFGWEQLATDWQSWSAREYVDHLQHPIAQAGFESDFDAMRWADTCVLVLPSGRSAHIEAGWMAGTGRRLYILALGENEPELMYKLAAGICLSVDELLQTLAAVGASPCR